MKYLRLTGILAVILAVQGSLFSHPIVQERETSETDQLREIVNGTVSSSDGVRLVGAEIRIDGTNWLDTSDETGTFSFKGLPKGMLVLVVSCPGFVTKRVTLGSEMSDSDSLDIQLDLEQQEFKVTVSPDMPQLMSAAKNIGVVEVIPSQVATLPSLGEKDIFRSLQLMPGVAATNESSSGLFVRGGTPDQNLMLLDGFTLYEVDHFFGVFSALNTNAIDNVTIHKGGFESKYGNRLSSVVDMVGNSGRSDKMAFGGGASFLSYNGYADIPLGTRGSFMFAGRKSFQSPFSDRIRDTYSDADSARNPAGRGFGGFATEPNSSFWDINARGTYSPTSRDELVFGFYKGEDSLDNSRTVTVVRPEFFADDNPSDSAPIEGQINNLSNWGNTGLSANWHRNWTNNLFSTLTFAHSRFFKNRDRSAEFDTGQEEDEDDLPRFSLAGGSSENNRLEDYTIKFSNFLSLGTQHNLEFGAEATRNEVNYHFNFRGDIALFDQDRRGWYYGLYLQDTWNPIPRLSLTPGIRANYFEETQKYYADPRLAVSYNVTDRFRLKAAGGRYHQFANRLIREDPLQGDQTFWMLSDGDMVPVGSSIHAIAGGSYETRDFLFDVEGFWKDLSGLSEFGAMRWRRGQRPEDINLGERFFTGTGTSEGVEFLAQKKTGQNTGWITYTLGKTEHLFPDISESVFPASYESRHEFKLVDSHRWKSFTFSGNWIYGSGKPYTLPTGVDEIILPSEQIWEIIELGEKNSARLPAYHRLDLSATWHFWAGETSRANAGVSVFNAYNKKNVWRKEFDVLDGDLIETDVNYLGLTISAFINVDLNSGGTVNQAGPISLAAAGSSGSSTKKAKKEKVFDFSGTVESMTAKELKVDSEWGLRTLLIDDATITGATSYDPGTPVHVYYLQRGDELIVTMVVRKVS